MSTFDDFLKFTNSQREISLVIAKDSLELAEFLQKLIENGFQESTNAFDLLSRLTKPTKSFFIEKNVLTQEVFDIIVQYPLGQIQIKDKQTSKLYTVSPDHKNISVVLLMTEQSIKNSKDLGFSILNKVGIIFRSN